MSVARQKCLLAQHQDAFQLLLTIRRGWLFTKYIDVMGVPCLVMHKTTL